MKTNASFEKFLFFTSLFVFIFYFSLFVSLSLVFDWNFNIEYSRFLAALKNSFLAAILSILLSSIFGIPTAYFLSRSKSNFSKIVDIVLEFPLIISPAALGALIVISLNSLHFSSILFTFPAIVIAQFLTVLGVFIRVLKSSFDQIEIEYEEMAWLLGANKFQTLFYILLPMARKGIISAIVLSFAKAFGEFGATFMVAGSIPYKTETIPILLFLQLSSAQINQTAISILTLTLIGLITIIVIKIDKNPPSK